ncbi:MAG: gluconate 2-dehydrogenase subunit 3 family protein [Bryobacteraceae bacterium]|nr:gluconate 2-dehydrogenase subunit 3 family protein [Bryobacteraceae bacterium]
MSDRRDALKGLASLTVLPVLAQQAHQHSDATPQDNSAPKAKFFSEAEVKELGEWVDLIIPRTTTPGARDANVHYLIDGLCHRTPAAAKAWRETLGWLRKHSTNRDALLARISTEQKTAGAKHFKRLKDTTIEQYYTTREGLQTELGWNANTYVAVFQGCTHPEHS